MARMGWGRKKFSPETCPTPFETGPNRQSEFTSIVVASTQHVGIKQTIFHVKLGPKVAEKNGPKMAQKWPKMAKNRHNSPQNRLHSAPNRSKPTPIDFGSTVRPLPHHPGIKPVLRHRNLGSSRGLPAQNGPKMTAKWRGYGIFRLKPVPTPKKVMLGSPKKWVVDDFKFFLHLAP